MLPTGGVILLVAAPALKTLLCMESVVEDWACAFRARLLISETKRQQIVRWEPAFCLIKHNTLLKSPGLPIPGLSNFMNLNCVIFMLIIIFIIFYIFKNYFITVSYQNLIPSKQSVIKILSSIWVLSKIFV